MDQFSKPSAPGLLALPNEVLCSVLAYLNKPDLKLVRLSCKRLSECAVPLLFNLTVISTSSTNITVFENICKHPLLLKQVKTLVYDFTEFSESDNYDQSIADQIIYDRDIDVPFPPWMEETLQAARKKVPYFWQRSQDQERTEGLPYKNVTSLIRNGETVMQKHYEQQLNPTDKHFVDVLLKGLLRLPSLTTLTLQSDWEKAEGFDVEQWADEHCSNQFYYGSLARTWHPLSARPRSACGAQEIHGLSQHFDTLFLALEKARFRLRNLDLHAISMLYAEDGEDDAGGEDSEGNYLWLLPMTSYIAESLVSLTVWISVLPGGPNPAFFHVAEADRVTVPPMPALRDLTLKGNICWWGEGTRDPIASAITRFIANIAVFPHLTTLCLMHCTVTSALLLDALKGHSHLRTLHLNAIGLHRGTWTDLIKTLAYDFRLDTFHLNRLSGEHKAREAAQQDIRGLSMSELQSQVESFVTGEGEYPFKILPPPDAGGYWEDLTLPEGTDEWVALDRMPRFQTDEDEYDDEDEDEDENEDEDEHE